MAAKTFWQWYNKELPRGDDASNFQAAWDAAVESIEENRNSDYAAALRVIDEYHSNHLASVDMFWFRDWCKGRINSEKRIIL